MPYTGMFGAMQSSSAGTYSGSNLLSDPAPYAEPDKTSRINAIFEGISSVITSGADAYSRIKYNPQPVGYAYAGAPSGVPNYTSPDIATSGQPMFSGARAPMNWTLIAVAGILVIVLFAMRR